MQNPIDHLGQKWAFRKISDKVGRHTIIAYRNQWIKGKGSRTAQRISVGRLHEDGSIGVVKGFLAYFPQYLGMDLYWGENELLSSEEFQNQYVAPAPNPDISWSNEAIHYALPWTSLQIAKQSGMLEDLKSVLGADLAQLLLNLAIYKLDTNQSMSLYEDWVVDHWLEESAPVNGRRISEALASINEQMLEKYFALRHQRAKSRAKDKKAGLTLSFDSTAISTYSETILDAAYGHAKQNPELKQVNLSMVCDHETGDVLFANTYHGSLNDKTEFGYALSRMISAGFDLSKNVLITDRGYQSIYNTALELKLDLKFIQGITLLEDCVKKAIIRRQAQLNDFVRFNDPRLGVNSVSEDELWSVDGNNGRLTHKIKLHLYRDMARSFDQIQAFKKEILDVIDQKNENKTIDPVVWKRVSRYVLQSKSKWMINLEKFSQDCSFVGCFAIRSNCDLEATEVLRLYRQRNIIEQGFQQLKNEVDGARLYATESTYRGKLFVFILAQAIRMSMLSRIKNNVKENSRDGAQLQDFLKLPYESLPKLLALIRQEMAMKHCSTPAFTIKPIPKKKRDILALLGVPLPPRVLYRFKC